MIDRVARDGGVATVERAGRNAAVLRLDAYGRYARVLAAQLESLQGNEPDLVRFNTLAIERAQIADEIEATPEPVVESPDLAVLMVEIRERMAECKDTDQAVLQRIGALRDGAASALEGIEERKAVRKGYTREPRGGSRGRRLDVKF